MEIKEYKTMLKSNGHIILRESRSSENDDEVYNNPEKLATLFHKFYNCDILPEEHLFMVALDAKMHPLGIFEVFLGTINSCLSSPREIYTRALLCNASAIVIAHNHPSGDTYPSKLDIKSYKGIAAAGEIIGIKMIDGLILGKNNSYFSFAEKEILSEITNE